MAKKKKVRTRVRTKPRSKKRSWNIFFLLPVLLIGLFVILNKPQTASVLGVSTVAFRSATITWQPVPNAVKYNIYYKSGSDKTYIHSVIGVSALYTTYTINYLKKDTNYQYMIAAVNGSGREFWFSAPKWMFAAK